MSGVPLRCGVHVVVGSTRNTRFPSPPRRDPRLIHSCNSAHNQPASHALLETLKERSSSALLTRTTCRCPHASSDTLSQPPSDNDRSCRLNSNGDLTVMAYSRSLRPRTIRYSGSPPGASLWPIGKASMIAIHEGPRIGLGIFRTARAVPRVLSMADAHFNAVCSYVTATTDPTTGMLRRQSHLMSR
jgi:hypothetical protein